MENHNILKNCYQRAYLLNAHTMYNQSDCRDFTIYASFKLIGCLEWEYLKKGLKSDVNSKVKSDSIVEIDFRYFICYQIIQYIL